MTGMVYLRARFYEPEMNRFSQKDIIRGSVTTPGSLNRYTYVQNDPINFIDPSGQSFKSIIKSAASKISSAAKTVVNTAKTVVNKVTTAVKTTATKVVNAAKSAYNKVSTAVKNVVSRGTSSSGSTSSYRGSSGGGSYSAAPSGYNPGSSGGSYFGHSSGKIPSPDAPRIEDADEETLKYCESGPRKATGNNYLTRSLKAFFFGDFSGENQTLLSLGLGIGAGILNVDAVLDVRDFVYDVTHIGQLDNPALALALDVVALVPVLGAVKYLRHVDDVADVVKHVDDVADAAKGIAKADNAVDVLKQSGNIADAARDAGKVDDVVGTIKDADKVADAAGSVNSPSRKFEDWLNKGNTDYAVYFGNENDVARYTGITKQPIGDRLSQHKRAGKNFSDLLVQHDTLTRNQARAIEQYYIENGPNEWNKINSIAKNSEYYKDAMEWAETYLGK